MSLLRIDEFLGMSTSMRSILSSDKPWMTRAVMFEMTAFGYYRAVAISDAVKGSSDGCALKYRAQAPTTA